MSGQLNIRALRLEKRLRQRDLAEAVGLSARELMKIERGFATPTAQIAKRLSVVLSVDQTSTPNGLQNLECGEGYVTARPESFSTRRRRSEPRAGRKYVVDLFCGVGGFSSGFEQTGAFEVVAGVDLLGDRLDTFVANHSTANAFGSDIRQLKTDALCLDTPRPFVIVGGPPCQGFSSIRPFRNVEWNDPRNNLAEEFCRVVADLQPEWVIFENVVGLLTHEGGRAFRAIEDAFEALGYRTEARVLNSAFYGVPQRRERLILVGNRRGKRMKWPSPTHYCEARSMVGESSLLVAPATGLFRSAIEPAVTVIDAIGDLPAIASGEVAEAYSRDNTGATAYSRYIRNRCDRLTHHGATLHSPKMLEIIRLSGSSIRALPLGMVSSGFSSCYSRLAADEPSVTLTVNFVHPASNRCIHPYQDRALTPREGARLQGFFDTFDFAGSRAQIVKQIGNAVPPVLGKAIAQAILESD